MKRWLMRILYTMLGLFVVLVVVNIFAIIENRNKIIRVDGAHVQTSMFLNCQNWSPLTNYKNIFYFSIPTTSIGLLKNFILAPNETVLFSHLDDGQSKTVLHGESSVLYHLNNKKMLFTKDRMRVQVFKIKTLTGLGNAIGKIEWFLTNKRRFSFEYGILTKASPILTFRAANFPDSFIYCKANSDGSLPVCKSSPQNPSLEQLFAAKRSTLIHAVDTLCDKILPGFIRGWKPLPGIKGCDENQFFSLEEQISGYRKACKEYKLVLKNKI